MQIYKPSYYEKFHCIASQCPDSCCKEWEVEVDDASAKFYRNLEGPLGDRLRDVLVDTPQWGTVMRIEDGRCPMWRTDALCRIQAELGHDALCKTCRNFPRLCHDYGYFQEWGLELSCPEAARLILTDDENRMESLEIYGGDTPDYDQEIMNILLRSRTEALKLLCTSKYSVPETLSLLLYYGYHIQSEIDGVEMADFDPDIHLLQAKDFAVSGGAEDLLAFYSELDCLTDAWKERLQHPSPVVWEHRFQNLIRYFIHRYWLQAVSDFDLVCRVKFTVASCIVIQLLGGEFLSTAQLYSKEIENSGDNVDAILDATYQHPAFTDRNLLGFLLK